jgi:hypothetical protein
MKYNKPRPVLKPSTRRYIKEDPNSPLRYFGKNGEWTQFRSEAKEYTDADVHAETHWKLPTERWLLVHD